MKAYLVDDEALALRGVLNLSQALVPHLRERRRGSIACMSSVSAQRGGARVVERADHAGDVAQRPERAGRTQ